MLKTNGRLKAKAINKYIFVSYLCVFLVLSCAHIKSNNVDTSILIGKWKSHDPNHSIQIVFTPQIVSVIEHNRVFNSTYSLKGDTLFISAFNARSKITELTKESLQFKCFDSAWNESVQLIYTIKFDREN